MQKTVLPVPFDSTYQRHTMRINALYGGTKPLNIHFAFENGVKSKDTNLLLVLKNENAVGLL